MMRVAGVGNPLGEKEGKGREPDVEPWHRSKVTVKQSQLLVPRTHVDSGQPSAEVPDRASLRGADRAGS